jgi:hypothetical protein
VSLLDRFDRLLARPVPVRPFALLRVFMGLVAFGHLRGYVAGALDGHIYSDAFHEPYAGWYPELPRALYVALLWVGLVACLALAAGVASRVAAAVTLGVVAYNLGLSTTHFHNHVAYLVIVLAAVAVVPCGRELSVDAWLRRRAGRPDPPATTPGWPLWLIRLEAAVVYGASGGSKLVDGDWFGGRVTWGRVNNVRDRMASETPLPDWAISVLTDRDVHTWVAKVIVLTELFIALGLWFHRTRLAAVWLAVVFHAAIELSATVGVFSYLAVGALVIWATPASRDRTVVGNGGALALVRRLDWLARFRVQESPGPLRVADRDGRLATGPAAWWLLLSRLPVTAPFVLPAGLFLAHTRTPRGYNAGHARLHDQEGRVPEAAPPH